MSKILARIMPVFKSVLAMARGALHKQNWGKLANALGLNERLAA